MPLPKSSGSRTKALKCDDFRGIAISCVISKVFEYCILNKFDIFLRSDDRQFGFKKGIGCSHAIVSIRKIVDRITMSGGTANLCSLDLSKAFDKVNHHALYIALMKRHLPLEILELLENWLSSNFSCVKWHGIFSRFFRVSFGVRQGSVLSPSLFAIYIDIIVSRFLPTDNCYIVLYADDILLIASSVIELQSMLDTCERDLTALDMLINASKSACIRIGSRFNIKCANLTTCSGHELQWVDEIHYLGVYIVCSRHFQCSICHCKKSFYRAINAIFGKIGRNSSEEVFLQLIYSKCIPVLIYGLECFVLNKTTLKALDFPVVRLLMRFFKTTNIELINECRSYFEFDLPSEILQKRSAKIINKYARSGNSWCRYLSQFDVESR